MLLVSIKVLAFFVLFSIMKYFTEDHIIANKQCQLSLFVDKHAKIYWFYKDWHSGGVPFALGKKRTKVCRHSKDYHIKYKEKRKQQKSVSVVQRGIFTTFMVLHTKMTVIVWAFCFDHTPLSIA